MSMDENEIGPIDSEKFFEAPYDPREVLRKQFHLLEMRQEHSKKPILVKVKEGSAPEKATSAERRLYQWNYFKDVWSQAEGPIYTRRILDNEILLDPDQKDWQTLHREMRKITNFLDKEKIPYDLSYTGGSGMHVSILLANVQALDDVIKNVSRYNIDITRIIRETLTDIIFRDSQARKDALELDQAKISFSHDHLGSMVREYGTRRPNGAYKTKIDTVPGSRRIARNELLKFPDKLLLWDFSKYITEVETALKSACEVAAKNEEYSTNELDFTGADLKAFPCIKKLLRTGRKTGRYYGAQSIALMSRSCGLSWQKTEPMCQKFLKSCDGLTAREIDDRMQAVHRMFESGGYHFSCHSVKAKFGKEYCDFASCELKKKLRKAGKGELPDMQEEMKRKMEQSPAIKARALDILKTGKPVDFLIEVYNSMHVSDQSAGKILLLSVGCTCDLTSNGIHPRLSGSSGKGKSHAAMAILHLVPKEHKIESSLSPKVLFYKKIPPGSILYSDDIRASLDMEDTMKRSTTYFQKGAEHSSLDKNNELREGKIPPRCVWWLSSVDADGSAQLINRQIDLDVDESREADEAVARHQRELARDGKPEFPENEDVWIAREIIREIKKNTFKVAIPFANSIEWNDESNRRNQPIFLDMVKAFAIFNFMQRERTADGQLLATFDDFNMAKEVYASKAEAQASKKSKTERSVLRAMQEIQKYQHDVTIKDIQEKLNLSRVRVYQILHGKDGKSGLLERVPGLSVQKISIPRLDEGGDEMGRTLCTVYHVSGFDELSGYTNIVSLKKHDV
jgi:hypothetical protein